MGRAMKDSGVEWIGEIPDTWDVRKLKNTVICNQDKGSFSGGAYIALENIESGSGRLISSEGEIQVDSTVTTFNNQSVLFGKLRPYLAKVARPSYAGQCSTEILVLTPLACCDKDYLFWCLISPMFIDNVNAATFGVKMPRANWNFIGGCFLPIPSTTEQRTISAFLDSKCAKINSIIDQTRTSIEEYKHLKQAVITQAVTKGVRGDRPMKESGIEWAAQLPVEWQSINPKALFSLRKDKATAGERQLTASQQYGIIYQDEYMEITGSKVVTVEKDFDILKHVEAGDFVISMRSFQGGLEYSELSGSISSAYVMLIPNLDQVYPKFYRWLLKFRVYIDALQRTSNMVRDGQAMRYSNFSQVRLYTVPMDEQKEIAAYLDEKCAKIDALIAKKEQLLTELESYKKSLIYEYVTGKKEVAP